MPTDPMYGATDAMLPNPSTVRTVSGSKGARSHSLAPCNGPLAKTPQDASNGEGRYLAINLLDCVRPRPNSVDLRAIARLLDPDVSDAVAEARETDYGR